MAFDEPTWGPMGAGRCPVHPDRGATSCELCGEAEAEAAYYMPSPDPEVKAGSSPPAQEMTVLRELKELIEATLIRGDAAYGLGQMERIIDEALAASTPPAPSGQEPSNG